MPISPARRSEPGTQLSGAHWWGGQKEQLPRWNCYSLSLLFCLGCGDDFTLVKCVDHVTWPWSAPPGVLVPPTNMKVLVCFCRESAWPPGFPTNLVMKILHYLINQKHYGCPLSFSFSFSPKQTDLVIWILVSLLSVFLFLISISKCSAQSFWWGRCPEISDTPLGLLPMLKQTVEYGMEYTVSQAQPEF